MERLLFAYGFGENLYTLGMLVFFPKLCEFFSFFSYIEINVLIICLDLFVQE
jgi:hypothetical protein